MDHEYLHMIRAIELDRALPILADFRNDAGRDIRILEIGSGTGWQARQLSEKNYDIEAIDLDTSYYRQDELWPITRYDGKTIPFPDEHFDVLLSSNVLEHIPHLEEFHSEMKRVLKPGGIAIHIVPSASWRIWSNLTHYPYILKAAVRRIFSRVADRPAGSGKHDGVETAERTSQLSFGQRVRGVVFPVRHGETGNVITETWHFSRRAWAGLFEGNGWRIRQYSSNRLFYTAYMLFGTLVSSAARENLSRFLGGSCHIFVIEEDRG